MTNHWIGLILCHNVPMSADRLPIPAESEPAVAQQGSARTVLLRILGDLAYPMEEPVPTAALLTILTDAGFGTHAARQAVSRCARIGLLAGVKSGRSTRWSLTSTGQALMADGAARARQLGTEPAAWDGRWLVLVVSVPHKRRVIRHKLYQALAWAGCGTPEPGIWITAHPETRGQISAMLARFELGLEHSAVSFVGEASGIGLSDSQLVAQAWDLDSVSSKYRAAVNRFDAAPDPISGSDAVRLLMQVDEVLQDMVPRDPRLPSDLCPGWTGRQDASRLLEYRDALLLPARAYWADLLR